MNQFLTDEKSIKEWLQDQGVESYDINDDMSVDVYQDVSLNKKQLSHFPVQFGDVKGLFDCSANKLTTLLGAPRSVETSFYCDHNLLTNLEGAPSYVGKRFNCANNHLTSLLGAPQNQMDFFICSVNVLTSLRGAPKEVMASFECDNNLLTSLEFCPESIGTDFECYNNRIKTLLFFPKSVGCSVMIRGNDALGSETEEISNFEELKKIHTLHLQIATEKELLSKQMENTALTQKIYKI